MEFRIADTFTDSLAKLTGEEQKVVKTTAFDLQLNPANPSMQFHKLDKSKDKNFWSVRVSGDLRLIVHKPQPRLARDNWGNVGRAMGGSPFPRTWRPSGPRLLNRHCSRTSLTTSCSA